MRRNISIAAVVLLGICLVGWAALVAAEPEHDKPVVAAPAAANPASVPLPPPVSGPPLPPPLPSPVPLPLPIVPMNDKALPQASLPAANEKPGAFPIPIAVPPLPPGPASPPALPLDAKPAFVPDLPALPPARSLPGSGLPSATDEAAPMSPLPTAASVGRQETAVGIEWIGPTAARLGQPADYSIVVRNDSSISVARVAVRARIPAGMSVISTEPKAVVEKDLLLWEVGGMLARQEKGLQLRLVADVKGDLAPQAWVTCTHGAATQIKVREPKLALKVSAPERVMAGDTATFLLTATNPGDGPVEQVRIRANLAAGLEHVRGNRLEFDVGNLAAGETRCVQLACTAKVGGMQKCEVEAEGAGGLQSADATSVNVILPRLDLQLSGPALRYLERKALYSLKVTNPGDAAAVNVTISDIIPAGFKVLAASDGGRHEAATRTVSWFLGEVGPGQSREVKFEVQAVSPGEHRHRASAVAARGLRAEADLATRVDGLSALLLEVVDTEDPIEVNGDTAYEVRVTNTGSKPEANVRLAAEVPDKMAFQSAVAPVPYRQDGKTIAFEPIEQLSPRGEAIFRINVKALEAGTVRFKIQMTSASLVEPVIKMEATRIYSDVPDAKSGQ